MLFTVLPQDPQGLVTGPHAGTKTHGWSNPLNKMAQCLHRTSTHPHIHLSSQDYL